MITKTKTAYTVTNQYNISGGSTHRSVGAALQARDKREGLGWHVVDQTGQIWDYDGNGFAVKIA